MSGDVQPRKRKEKRRKKEDSEEIATNFSSDEQLHVHKDASTGGNICAKILFFLLSFMLLVMIGLVVVEYRGSADDEALVPVSKWAPAFDGWLEAPVKHGEHAEVTESGEQEHGESGEHEDESAEGEEHLSEEAASKEDDEEEAKESEEEETKSAEEEEEDQEEEEEDDNEVDKLEDEESEEVDENETEEVEDREEDEEDQEEDEGEGSEEYLYKHGKSEEDIDEDEGGADNGGEEEDEEAELGREEPDDDDDDEERDMSAYGHESDENDDLLREIPGITESDEDEEGDKGSDEVTDQRQKTADTHEQKIKAGSKEQADVPRRKQEKQVSGRTEPVEGPSTVTGEQMPSAQHKNQDRDKSKGKVPHASVKQDDVMKKPAVPKPEALYAQKEPASQASHVPSSESPAMKNDGFPSGPGETVPSQKTKDEKSSKATPSKKQKINMENAKDNAASEATLPKKQKDVAGPSSKSKSMPADLSKPIASGTKSSKDKDLSSEGIRSSSKASEVGGKMEPSQKESHHRPSTIVKDGKSDTLHKVTEQSTPTKLDAGDRASISQSSQVNKVTEEHKKPMEGKDKLDIKLKHTAPASDIKSTKEDIIVTKKTADDTIKRSDFKAKGVAEAPGKLRAARNSGSVDNQVKLASDHKESVHAKSGVKVGGNFNSQTQKVKHSAQNEKKIVENEGLPSNREKNVEQVAPKLDSHAKTVKHVDGKESVAAKVHEESKKSKVNIEKQKAGSLSSGRTADGRANEVPVKDSTDKVRKVSTDDSTKTRAPEMSSDVNAGRKESGTDNIPSEGKHYSKTSDSKASATLETPSLKHSVRKKTDSPKTEEVKLGVQRASSRTNSRKEEERSMSSSENLAASQEKSVNNKPVTPNLEKTSHSQKHSSQQMENEVVQPKNEGSSRTKAVPTQQESVSETVK